MIAKRNGVALVPTPVTEINARELHLSGSYQKMNKTWFTDPVKRAHEAGVTLVFGPDVIITPEGHTRGGLSIDTIAGSHLYNRRF